MPSHALVDWTGRRADRLDRLVDAHRAVGGAGPGRRWLTAELNHALIVRLASEFQGYCRDLHDEASRALINQRFSGDEAIAAIVHAALVRDRRLDRGNASWANIVVDFGRLGLSLREEIAARRLRGYGPWTEALERLNDARNALAHDDPVRVASCERTQRLTLQTFRSWRRQVHAVASAMDAVVGAYLTDLNGARPW